MKTPRPVERSEASNQKSKVPMNYQSTAAGRQAGTRVRLLCAGCGACVAPPFTTLGEPDGPVGFLCPPCDRRHEDSTVFRRIVDACVWGGKTVPEVEAAFAGYGLPIPTTESAMRAAASRIYGAATA